MSKTLAQIFAINPTTIINNTDLFYLVQSPYTPGTDAAISGASMKAIFGTGGTVNPGLINQLAYYAAAGNTLSGLATANNGLLVTSAIGTPSILAGPGTTGNVLQSNAAAPPSFSTATYPSVATSTGSFLYANGTNWVASTSLWPNTVAPVGKIIRSDGTTNTYTTTIYPDLVTQNSILYGSASNTIGLLATVTRSVLTVPSTGLPTYVTLTDGQLIIGSTAGSPAAASLTAGAGISITPGSNSISIAASSGAGSPLTTKGDIYTFSTVNDRLPVATGDGKVLQVSSGAATGLAYSTPTYPSASGTSGKFLISDGTNNIYSTSTIPTSAGATANKVLLSNGTNYVLSTPTFPNASATLGKIIISDGTNWIASTPTYPAVAGTAGNVLTSDGTNWLSSPAAGVTLLTTKGDLFGFSTVNARVPAVAGNGKVLQIDSTASVGLSYSTPTYPSASGTTGKILISDGTNNVYSTPTYPNSASGTGTILRADGTNWVATTATYPATTTINQILYSSAANVISGLATANNGVLVTNGTGVPSIAAAIAASNLLPLGTNTVTAIGSTTYAMTTATGGTATVTGLAFQPSLVIFLASPASGGSVGFDNGTAHVYYSFNPTVPAATISTSFSIRLIVSTGNDQQGLISSFTSDGFVITFTKTGSPTGTGTIAYLAFK